ncbi:NAD(P)H-hydrate epimerase [Candidatus Woesearchaeota archaeon]|jgi:hydroxyethylthiazole kinase-like uncharacterized protein yjeF|nr:NAD(P)H-hydrate epimerase [Candidatus Woesearchaeota archaeon]MBT5396652.1 NAD(P)H-hydrate epimerase [Candidatus Woesearchaeota archaeon]MBT5924220.1 NAD(P)H-hydrate epimerase [Candidatus Woesearchaeota archaeon]MBT6367561.1 NAD(P)H-hydrate epimerase [Candidatus Woesearchaeota archaeon]MBT7763060.1 NAD(P)H-hydrate epimerase [Candidatus Woesearchaeota archaeon]
MITAQEIKALEHDAVQQGISISQLMGNAGRKVFDSIKQKYDIEEKHIIIFSSHGNNGGDGFVAARHFAEECFVTILFFGWEDNLTKEAKESYDKIKDTISIIPITTKEELSKFRVQNNVDLILIDALLGTGIQGNIREPVSLGIDYFNSLSGIKVAVDVPSGLNADTGKMSDKQCDVDLIICFHDVKKGLESKDNVVVVDIGLPK